MFQQPPPQITIGENATELPLAIDQQQRPRPAARGTSNILQEHFAQYCTAHGFELRANLELMASSTFTSFRPSEPPG